LNILKVHSFREFSVFEIREPLESSFVKINSFREFCVLEIGFSTEVGVCEANIGRELCVLEISRFVEAGVCEAGIGRELCVLIAALKIDILIKDGVVRFILIIIMNIGEHVSFENTVGKRYGRSHMI